MVPIGEASVDKQQVIVALREVLRADLVAVERGARMAIDEATSTESKAENEYDTRSLEASYLARGQSERVGALRRILGYFDSARVPDYGDDDPIGLLALVCLEADDRTRWVFIAPSEGGRTVDVGGEQVRLVTPESPLGTAIVGRTVGDVVALETPGDTREYEITAVS